MELKFVQFKKKESNAHAVLTVKDGRIINGIGYWLQRAYHIGVRVEGKRMFLKTSLVNNPS